MTDIKRLEKKWVGKYVLVTKDTFGETTGDYSYFEGYLKNAPLGFSEVVGVNEGVDAFFLVVRVRKGKVYGFLEEDLIELKEEVKID